MAFKGKIASLILFIGLIDSLHSGAVRMKREGITSYLTSSVHELVDDILHDDDKTGTLGKVLPNIDVEADVKVRRRRQAEDWPVEIEIEGGTMERKKRQTEVDAKAEVGKETEEHEKPEESEKGGEKDSDKLLPSVLKNTVALLLKLPLL